MHRLIKIRIIRDFESLEERVRRWRDTLFELKGTGASFWPAVDLFETAQGLVLRLEAAGLAQEDLSLTLAGQELVVRGRRRSPDAAGINRFLHLEMSYGTFERSFSLPIPIDPEGVRAQYRDGILEVRLPRKLPQSRQIPVTERPDHD